MFVNRREFPDNDEFRRHKIIKRVIFGDKPNTFLEKKAAAVVGHPYINFVIQAKIYKALDDVLELFTEESELHDALTKIKIRNLLKSINIVIGDRLSLPVKSPILARVPETPPSYNYVLDVAPISAVNVALFESLCFNNKTLYNYFENTEFASYLYQNLLFSLNATCLKNLENNISWQARLASLLFRTEFSDYVATTAFYEDFVEYGGVFYDTSFVPKYDVKSLNPIRNILKAPTNQEFIDYYYDLNVFGVKKIPNKFIGIFLTFPFKFGHYVQPDGTIVFPNIFYPQKRSVRIAISELCDMSDLEAAIESTARMMEFEDALSFALYAPTLKDQGVALLVLRQMLGPILSVGPYKIQLPTANDVLIWTKMSCDVKTVILPPLNNSKTVPLYVSLVKDIAESCITNIGAAILCSAYRVPEIDLRGVFDQLTTNEEKYVFFTLLLQEYNISMYHNARNQLNPKFKDKLLDLSKYPTSERTFENTTIQDRLDAFTETLVRPTDASTNIKTCSPYKCSELYEFANQQLNDLAATNNVILDDIQLAGFLALCVD